MNLDAINVLTIHKSKGLEFDCVVIPFADWSLMGSRVLPSDKTSSIYWVTRSEWVAQKGLSLTPNLADEGLVPPLIPVVKKHLKSYASLRGDFSQLVNREEESTLIDGMNKTYVAFTRPREELHVFAKTGRGKVSELLQQHFMLAAGQPHPDLTVQEIRSGVYQCGEPRRTPKHAHALLNGRVEPMPPYKVTQSSRQVVVKLPREITDKHLMGNRLHNLMSRIFYRRDVERAIHFCLNRGIISRDDPQWPLTRIRRMLVHMFEDHRTSVWFSDDNRVYNERNVYSPEKTRHKRPDRVVRRPNGDVLVVDYKFGQEDLADNVKQVRGYMTDLHAAGMTHVVGFLWYVTEDKVYRVTPQDVQEVI